MSDVKRRRAASQKAWRTRKRMKMAREAPKSIRRMLEEVLVELAYCRRILARLRAG